MNSQLFPSSKIQHKIRFQKTTKINIRQIYRKNEDHQQNMDLKNRGLEIKTNLNDLTILSDLKNIQKQIKTLNILPKNLEYLFKLGWCYCTTHSNKRIIFNHILEDHLSLPYQMFLESITSNGFNNYNKDRIEQENDKLYKQHIIDKRI
ncbi:unnamed protein product (macronuclear) [Paramecium tetraurelia]|uniref:Uncharacterized protein n=1 Tax=Paramecium tetraurelia TaxID=5888 RepID=A0BT95_PARTE|nr:uncharacterized protein GSPATT00031994001 [Paramecium tetraurelia]CAK61762.1 unnamed protein product [Paramecium tetraurelia]|eukprot:XP_001429160.1 hypothetical protein (macronuclear) [Paramecium tetraurelia strain d4-2]